MVIPTGITLMDEESIEGMVILLGITSQWTSNQPREWLFCQELSAHERGIHRRNWILPGIISSLTLIQTGKIKMRTKILPTVILTCSLITIALYCNCQLLKKFKYKTSFMYMKNNPDPALL
jgi:hypothetical protein